MAPDDVLVLSATDALTKQTYVLASFHGDTDGLATVPVVKTMAQLLAKQPAGTRHVFGMDANTYAVGSAKQQAATSRRHLGISAISSARHASARSRPHLASRTEVSGSLLVGHAAGHISPPHPLSPPSGRLRVRGRVPPARKPPPCHVASSGATPSHLQL